MTDETQPDGLAAFLAGAGYHVLQAPKSIPEDASESLIAAGCYYAPRLLAAVEKVLAEADKWATLAPPDDWGESTHGAVLADAGRSLRGLITRELTTRAE